MKKVLVARQDSLGDVILAGPAIRAVATHAETILLCGPRGAAASDLLPGTSHHLVWNSPWVAFPPPSVERQECERLIRSIHALHIDEAIILTSYHQSPLPLALLLRLAGVAKITALSEDYGGSLLSTRLVPGRDIPHLIAEHERALRIVRAAGYELPAGDDGLPALRVPPHDVRPNGEGPYIVLHPGSDAPARQWPAEHAAALVPLLREDGFQVAVTGSTQEVALAERVAGTQAQSFAGATDLNGLVSLISSAAVVISGNSGPGHIAAACRTPVVSLFSPVVPWQCWAPATPHRVVLGDQRASCHGSRARICPIPGHPCLSSVTAEMVRDAVRSLTTTPAAATAVIGS